MGDPEPNDEFQSNARTPIHRHAKVSWSVGVFLLTALYATVLAIWGPQLSFLVVVVLGFGVVVAFGLAAFFQIRSIGGRRWLVQHFHSQPFGYVGAIVVFCCLIFGTAVYLAVRPPPNKSFSKNQDHPMPAANRPPSPASQLPPAPAASQKPVGKAKEEAVDSRSRKRGFSAAPAVSAPTINAPAPVSIPPTAQAGQQCATGSQCNTATGGGTITNPTVYNYKDPPPRIIGLSIQPLKAVPPFELIPGENESSRMMRASSYHQSLGDEVSFEDYTYLPGLRISFQMSAPFVSPAFRVVCDRPCQVTGKSVNASDGQGRYISQHGLPSVISPQFGVVISVRSKDSDKPISNATVEPVIQ